MWVLRCGAWSVRAGLIAALIGVQASADEIIPLIQTREVEDLAEITGEAFETDSDFLFASDFSPFVVAVDATADLGDPEDPVVAHSNADQNSVIGLTSIKASGGTGVLTSAEQVNLFPSGSSRSFFSVTFVLDKEIEFSLSGLLDATTLVDEFAVASFALEDTDGVIYAETTSGGQTPLLAGGFLPAGTYTISASAESDAAGGDKAAGASFLFDFTIIPEPATGLLLGLIALASGRRR